MEIYDFVDDFNCKNFIGKKLVYSLSVSPKLNYLQLFSPSRHQGKHNFQVGST